MQSQELKKNYTHIYIYINESLDLYIHVYLYWTHSCIYLSICTIAKNRNINLLLVIESPVEGQGLGFRV